MLVVVVVTVVVLLVVFLVAALVTLVEVWVVVIVAKGIMVTEVLVVTALDEASSGEGVLAEEATAAAVVDAVMGFGEVCAGNWKCEVTAFVLFIMRNTCFAFHHIESVCMYLSQKLSRQTLLLLLHHLPDSASDKPSSPVPSPSR